METPHDAIGRRRFISLLGAGAALAAVPRAWGQAPAPTSTPAATPTPALASTPAPAQRIKAFCIDFNWLGARFAGPGTFAKASPRAHFAWYQAMGVNTIQTFCVNCCGFAWWRGSKVAPVTPGLASDFLPEITALAHSAGMRSMGYFCVAANTYWAQTHPDLSLGMPLNAIHIPLTLTYLDNLTRSMTEALTQTGIDGFMIDWVWSPTPRWIAAEQQMYGELMGEPFPGARLVTPAKTVEFGKRAVDRAWKWIRQAAKAAKPDAVIWLSCNNLLNPQVSGSALLREVDWIMNEDPDSAKLALARRVIGPQGKIVQAVCGWGARHDATKLITTLRSQDVGFYGFAAADPRTTLPPEPAQATDVKLAGNAANIAVLRRVFREL